MSPCADRKSSKASIMSKRSLDEDLKPKSVFVEDAEAQEDLGSYSHNVNARCDLPALVIENTV